MKKIPVTLLLLLAICFAACNTTWDTKEPISGLTEETDIGELVTKLSPVKSNYPLPFSRGINFSGWFEASSVRAVAFTAFTEEDFLDARSMGVEVIRLPIRLHSMTGGAPSYTIDPLLFELLDRAVDWAEKYRIYIILDNHSFDPVGATDPQIGNILFPVWEQMAEHYKNRSEYVIYEILNEPHGIDSALWGEIQEEAVARIRRIDPRRRIIVGGVDYNSIEKLFALPRYNDADLIYTFHFYDPYVFTHQGETWGGKPNLTNLKGLPFPYDLKRMPKIPSDLKGTWVEGNLKSSYMHDAVPEKLASTLDRAVAFSNERGVPVFCGEFGVYMKNSLNNDRVRWYRFVSYLLDARNISRASWDYFGGFGIFNGEGGSYPEDVNVRVVSALGFTVPASTGTEPAQIGLPFTIYDDYPSQGVSVSYWGENSIFDMYDEGGNGKYAIRWENAARYDAVSFAFRKMLDLSETAPLGAELVFEARSRDAVKFDVRFVNPEEPGIPWRCSFSVNSLSPDGAWHTIRIPLKTMRDSGAWLSSEEQWLNPEGKFAWDHVQRLQFVAEETDLLGSIVYIDSIRIENNTH
jgi:endoglucanase